MTIEFDLTHCLEGIPLPLAARQYHGSCADPERAMTRWCRAKQAAGDIILYTMMVQVPKDAALVALIDHDPARPSEIDVAAVAYQLDIRDRRPARPVVWMGAAKRLNAIYGGFCGYGRRIRSADANHEFRKALLYYGLSHEERQLWHPEQRLKAERFLDAEEFLPDAILMIKPPLWLEVGGRYGKQKCRARARAWATRRYQVW
jgi:hypothetical protein